MGPSTSPPRKRKGLQFSLATMMLMMLVFSVFAAGLYYASRIPGIADELAALTGLGGSSNHDGGRLLQITFIMFTYSMPLIMAGTLSTVLSVWEWLNRR